MGSFRELRRKAEEQLAKATVSKKQPKNEIHQLIQELQIHEIELQMQNESLMEREGQYEKLYRKYIWLYELAPVAYLTIDSKGQICEANAAAGELLGVSTDLLVNTPLWQWVVKEDRDVLYLHFKDLQYSDFRQSCELRMTSTHKGQFYALFNSTALQKQSIEYLISFTDITKQKRAEQDFIRLERIESLGTLAGGIAHDFNNLLLAILVNINLAQRELKPDDSIQRPLNTAEKAICQAKTLTQQLLTFAKGGDPVKEITSITKIAMDSAEFATSGSNIVCKYHFAEDLWPVEVDKGQIGQVISNIVLNSVQAMPSDGTITIAAENTIVSAVDDVPLAAGKYIRLTIADKGCGIAREDLPRIFDPYFSKKKGSGLGLSIVHSIIHKHSGLVEVESQLDEGTTFVVYLPAHPCQALSSEKEPFIAAKTAKVLVMEDDTMLLETIGNALSMVGYEVELAKDGGEAIKLYRQAREEGVPFDVVALDLTVRKGMGGAKTIAELRKIEPKIKAIVTSGYSDDPVMANYKKYGFAAVIAKPYNLDELCLVLNNVLR